MGSNTMVARATPISPAAMRPVRHERSTLSHCQPGAVPPSASGLTLGGGIGLLGGKHGLTCDRLVGAQVVLADGSVVVASTTTNPDVFWDLRGAGGGQFGVVTSLRFTTVPEPMITRIEAHWLYLALEDSSTSPEPSDQQRRRYRGRHRSCTFAYRLTQHESSAGTPIVQRLRDMQADLRSEAARDRNSAIEAHDRWLAELLDVLTQ
jgi:FAD/FMN-containing dehydrogenase